LESLLWHPYSAIYQAKTGDFKLNDDVVISEISNQRLCMMKPPRSPIPTRFNVTQIVHDFAKSMQLSVLVTNHLIMCNTSGDLLLVDFILESETSSPILLSIEYQNGVKRRQNMTSYMKLVESACHTAIGVNLATYLLTITDSSDSSNFTDSSVTAQLIS
jgi:hypothetical protein